MSPLYQGATCQPQNAANNGICGLGGFPLYSVKATNVAQIQLAVNFARTLDLRLVIRNTGHDFLGKNTGAGSLSIWTHNLKASTSDIFWAVRGGGGATWGVVTSMTVRVYPKTKFAGLSWSVNTAEKNISSTAFWSAMEAYWRRFPEFSVQKTYGYSTLFPAGNGAFLWSMRPWMVPGMALSEFKAMVEPLVQEWTTLGFSVEPEYFEHDNFYTAWKNHFPMESVGTAEVRTASRLISKANWGDLVLLNKTIATLKDIINEGSALIQYNINAAAPADATASAANPAWREALIFAIIGGG
ncbi:FAD-linked oxidoreductase ZEB1 [Colletotrichum spaethianum]|uniref:FAD-linked oxidoreductase ZEB1 n=1 Tax=Colletotrichum spaethianum TaxID=700344 RepID=A0AA37NWC1_9PEZI|nr:FAD-linked oxidoreductase ZEB1 [Colletotrichum spaethianum]GKT41180.1 FAD-linked oxidoreductase ZEB1 [Colletotrichum spaethianum]